MATVQLRTPAGDVHTVDEQLADYYGRQGWTREATPAEIDAIVEEAHELRGAALDDALKEAGLSTAGTAEEKRARLADFRSLPTEE
jgi:hypothetical protein